MLSKPVAITDAPPSEPKTLEAHNRERQPMSDFGKVTSAKYGVLIFGGCERHPGRYNLSCAKVRIESTGEILKMAQIWVGHAGIICGDEMILWAESVR